MASKLSVRARKVLIVYSLLATIGLAVGTLGDDPMGMIFFVPLYLPWFFLMQPLVASSSASWLGPLLTAGAAVINGFALYWALRIWAGTAPSAGRRQ